MIAREVASLAHSLGVEDAVLVWAVRSIGGAPVFSVAARTHILGVVLPMRVRAGCVEHDDLGLEVNKL